MSTDGPSIGVIGLGLVGRAICARGQAAGLAARGHDVSEAALGAAARAGVTVRESLSALAADNATLIVCVYDSAQLAAVIDQIIALARRPQLVCHCVTADAEISATLAGLCKAAGIAFAEMPLAGSSRQIAAGEAPAWVGATSADWQVAKPVIETLAPLSLHVGPPGAGARAKLATNLVLGLNRLVLAEGLLFAESIGIEGSMFLDLLRRSPAFSRAVDTIGDRMVRPDGAMVSRIGQHRKDVGLMLEAATRAGVRLPLSAAHAALLDEAALIDWGQQDNSALLQMLRSRGQRHHEETKS